MFRKSFLLGGVAISASLVAFAADAQANRKATQTDENTISELIVTAEKREQKLQEVPIAISAYTAKRREDQGITSIQDIANFTPGLTYSSSLDRAAIRGVGRLTNRLSSEAAVATYSDGFYTTSVAEAGKSTLIVDRVEVLRGPQGTLYGRNAIGGAINVISKHPSKTLTAEARVNLGNYGLQNYEVLVSGPVTDWARIQGYGQYVRQTEGYFRNVATGKQATDALNRNYLEFQAEIDVGDNGLFWMKYAKPKWFSESGNGGGGISDRNYDYDLQGVDALNFSSTYGLLQPGHTQVGTVTCNPQWSGCAGGDPRTYNLNTQNPIRITDHNINILEAQYTHHFENVDFKYIGGYDSYFYDSKWDIDGSPLQTYQIPLNVSPLPSQNTCQYVPGCKPLTMDVSGNAFQYTEDNRWVSHEVNFSSSGDHALNWIFGAYYFKEWYHNPQVSFASQPGIKAPSGAAVGNAKGNAPNPNGEIYHFDYDMTTRSMAAFGQLDWKINQAWQFTAGLRYTSDHKEGDESFRALCYTVACIGDPRVYGTLIGSSSLDITTLLAAGYTSAPAARVDGVVTAPTQVSPTKWVNYNIDAKTGYAVRDLKNDWSGVTGTLGVEWHPSNDTNAYFRYGRGYKSGGFNPGEIVPNPSTDPEFVDSFEVGLKKDFGSTLQLNSAIFYYNYKDLQIPIRVLVSTELGNVIQTRFLNVPKSVSKGVEIEGTWKPIRGLNITGSYSYNPTEVVSSCSLADQRACVLDTADPLAQDSKARPVITIATPTEVPTTKVLQSLKGNSLPYAPASKLALSVGYTWLLSKSSFTLGGNYVWRDESYANLFTREYNRAPAWNSKDFRAVWRTYDGRYTVIGYVRNAFDQLTYPAAGGGARITPTTPGQYNNVVKNLGLNPPRTYGVQVFYKFQ